MSLPTEGQRQGRVKVVYRPEDVRDIDYVNDLGDPGAPPFTRGIHPEMYRRRLWTMRQYAGFGTAREANHRFRYLLAQGTTGLSVAFDLPTQIGLDSDHSMSRGEVGRVGVAVDSIEDMRVLFDEIPLGRVSTSMTINATAAILLALYVAVARERGVDWSLLRGTIQNDILKEYLARGTYIYPPGPSLRLVVDLFAFCRDRIPAWNAISVSGYHIREAGSTAVQEVAFTLANAETYLDAAVRAGLEIEEIAPQISFFFAAHNDLFEEVAKFRAARRCWSELLRHRYSVHSPRCMTLRFHTQTAGSTLVNRQPENNVVRVAIQALAAILGGTQSLHTNARDEALALPSEESATVALRTQQILAFESGITQVADPLGGSWYLERLTKDLAEDIESYLGRIREQGGVLAALERGFLQREIQDSAFAQQVALEEGRRVVVGLNRFTETEVPPIEVERLDPSIEERQIAGLRAFRAGRNTDRAARALEKIRRVAQTNENLLPSLIDAVEASATLGEIASALRDVFGEYRESVSV